MARADQKRQRLYRLSPERCALPQGAAADRRAGSALPRSWDSRWVRSAGVWRQAHGAPASRKPTLTTNLRVLMSPKLSDAGALAGCTVIDLSRVLGGPYCTQILADHGADVLKIEPPGGDETRAGAAVPGRDGVLLHRREPQQARHGAGSVAAGGPGAAARAAGRRRRAGRELQARHAGEMGLGLRDAEPGIPEADPLPRQRLRRRRAAGRPARLRRLRPGHVRPDEREWRGRWRSHPRRPARGGHGHRPERGRGGAAGAERRARSGLGQFLDITLYDCALSLLHPHAPNYFYSGKTPARSGNAHPNIAPYETLPTASGPIFLAVGNNRQFAQLADTLGAPELARDPRYAANADRLANRQALRDALSALLATHEAAALADRLLRAGVPAAAVQTVDQALAHPHTRHRGMLLEQGDYRGVGSPIKLSRTPARLRGCRRRWAARNQRPASGAAQGRVRGAPSRPAPGLRGADPRHPASRPARSRCRGCRWETR